MNASNFNNKKGRKLVIGIRTGCGVSHYYLVMHQGGLLCLVTFCPLWCSNYRRAAIVAISVFLSLMVARALRFWFLCKCYCRPGTLDVGGAWLLEIIYSGTDEKYATIKLLAHSCFIYFILLIEILCALLWIYGRGGAKKYSFRS